MLGVLRLLRPMNCFLSFIAVLIGGIIALGTGAFDHLALLCLGGLVAGEFTAAGNSLNDYLDVGIDRKAHPMRPLVSGEMAPEWALNITIIKFMIALFLGQFLPPLAFVILIVNLIIMVSYEVKLKNHGLVGNISISWLTATLFLFAGAIVGALWPVLFISAMAFLANLGREIIKDVEDMDADIGKRRTLPMAIGKNASLRAASAFLVIAIGLSILPYIFGIFHYSYLLLILVADLGLMYTIYSASTDPRKSSSLAKMAMAMALVSFIIGGLMQ